MHKNNEMISVIIPVYNAETYLDHCISSVLQQTYADLEIILVNDGSTDSSADLCDLYAQRDKRIKVHHQDNGGVSAARNSGMKLAAGGYIFFLDSDDVIPVYSIEVLHNIMLREQADIVQGNIEKKNSYDFNKNKEYDSITYTTYTPEQFICLHHNPYRIFAQGHLLRADTAKKYSFPDKKEHEEIYYNGLILTDDQINKITHINLVTYYYIDNKSSITHNRTIHHFLEMEKSVRELYGVIKKRTENSKIINGYLLLYLQRYCIIKYDIIIRGQFKGEIKESFQNYHKQFISELWHSNINIFNKIAYTILSSNNMVYRIYIYYRDPTMRYYEKSVKRNIKNLGSK